MSSIQRDLELLLLGAILADPELKTQIDGFSELDLSVILTELKSKNTASLKKFLSDRDVVFQNGKGEALAGIRKRQRQRWIQNEIASENIRLNAATKFHSRTGINKAIERLQILKEMLNPDETPKPKKLLKPPAPVKQP